MRNREKKERVIVKEKKTPNSLAVPAVMTKREFFAIMILQGYYSSSAGPGYDGPKKAVAQADKLIAALDGDS